jgi:hypothetical protein
MIDLRLENPIFPDQRRAHDRRLKNTVVLAQILAQERQVAAGPLTYERFFWPHLV